MEMKPTSQQNVKRQSKLIEEIFWDCSVCTYRNKAEAFKCLMCDVRKGTSTRKPRLNPQLVAQVAQIFPAPLKTIKKDIIAKDVSSKESSGKVRTEKKRQSMEGKSVNKKWRPPRLKNVDRSNAETHAIAVNNVTVLITEYKPKVKKTVSDTSGLSSSASSDNGSQSESSTDARGDF